jgi:alanine dehydrogenase
MQLRLLSANDVRIALPMHEAIETARAAFAALSAGKVDMPLRSSVATNKGVTFTMPAYRHSAPMAAVKMVSAYNENPRIGLPVVNAVVIVLDADTGLPNALMAGNALTAIRTGAGGGLAADLLARRAASVVALFGAGTQARAQLQGVMAVRAIEQVNLISRTGCSARKLADEIRSAPDAPAVSVTETPRQAVADADIVITATTSRTPVFDGEDLKPGTHITGIGSYTPQMQEVDAATVRRATVVVDSRAACSAEAGDIIVAGARIDAELGEIVNGDKPGRRSEHQLTFFKSVGIAIQDAVAAEAVVQTAQEQGLGQIVTL